MKKYLLLTLSALTIGCTNLEPAETAHFFDVDSLVTEQILYLADARPEVIKAGEVQGSAAEETVTRPDSLQWTRELAIFKNVDINKPRLREQYREETKTLDNGDRQISYVPIEKGDLIVQHITLRYDGENLRVLEATIKDTNPLYSSKRDIRMEFEGNADELRLASYFIEGGQKMRIKDSVTFDLNARISYTD